MALCILSLLLVPLLAPEVVAHGSPGNGWRGPPGQHRGPPPWTHHSSSTSSSLSSSVTANTGGSLPGVESYIAPAGYPTSAFTSYYPVPSGQQPQPVLYDPVLDETYPLNLTNPDSVPEWDNDPVYYANPIVQLTLSEQEAIIKNTTDQIDQIVTGSEFQSNCTKCKASLSAIQFAAQRAPERISNMMVGLCQKYELHSNETCVVDFNATTFGAIWTQILQLADVTGLDGDYICHSIASTTCLAPAASPLDANEWFPKPKPADAAKRVPKPSGKRVKVLHMSDFHLDPRYKTASEGNCTNGLCCRVSALNEDIPDGDISFPAPLYGYFDCDTPYDLGLAALQAIAPLTGTSKEEPFGWTVYTGDLVSHDEQNQLSRAYVEYAEYSVFDMMKKYITGPVFATLGNHDSNPEAINAPNSMPDGLGGQMSWNYDHVARLWKHEGWIDEETAQEARLHYGGYSVKNHFGLRMLTFNSDFWYKSNYLNYINTSDPDVSGQFKWLIKELQDAEDQGERVWLFGHVLSGWDGSNPLPNPTNLFYQIIDRYSPHVIANVFFGHTHEDQLMIYYANNATVQSRDTALTPGWIGPSVTPLTNLNSGFRMYEVDTGNFDIYEAHTFYSDVQAYSSLSSTGPTFEFEYSTREAYASAIGWPEDAPLNATFWHGVTEAMEEQGEGSKLVDLFNGYQSKLSVMRPNCTSIECVQAKVCYIRSGSVPIGRQCPQGYGSNQSPYKPT
ncbi:hypothetical protein K431DRAFT_284283 [Polychaeton citri CBS 116435]|uniref:Calcineurin-like phosphoesterase domain-containing protein n=1 Tax=Polychaeton citri CBS 116435 TaxID=1314669 RepID=A0A9P4QCC1_9PEZI|nr:hypothetical protein K431DRAFT_284283 [Polychaeton citri CBS 116435]